MSYDEQMQAWREMNAVLDANGGIDSPEYRAAWEKWADLVRRNGVMK